MQKAIPIAVLVAFAVSVLTISGISTQEAYDIPSWVKNTAKWYGQGDISDSDFVSAIQFLIDKNILKISSSGNTDDEYMQEYKEWARSEIKKFQDYADKLKTENAELEKQVSGLRYDVNKLKNENELLSQRYDRVSGKLADERQEKQEKSYEAEYYREYVSEIEQWLEEESSKPTTIIEDQKIHWKFSDSKGNSYSWSMPIETYEGAVKASHYYDTLNLQLPNGDVQTVGDFREFVIGSFSNVIDDVYENSYDDVDFIYEVWYITSQLTIYSTDIGEQPRLALETLARGGGDCEDTAILVADMLKSSRYTSDWTIEFIIFDSKNPESARNVNHVAVIVDTGTEAFVIETTAKNEAGMNQWNGQKISGWRYDV